jgi:hypothetical protein
MVGNIGVHGISPWMIYNDLAVENLSGSRSYFSSKYLIKTYILLS